MEEASGVDLAQFRLWYSQAGTPRVAAELSHDAASKTAELVLRQTVPSTPGQPEKQPMHIPLKLALFGRESGARLGAEQLVELRRPEERIAFADLAEPPVLSINRDFSATVVVGARRGRRKSVVEGTRGAVRVKP